MFTISEVVPFIVELAQGSNMLSQEGLGHDTISSTGEHPNLHVHS